MLPESEVTGRQAGKIITAGVGGVVEIECSREMRNRESGKTLIDM